MYYTPWMHMFLSHEFLSQNKRKLSFLYNQSFIFQCIVSTWAEEANTASSTMLKPNNDVNWCRRLRLIVCWQTLVRPQQRWDRSQWMFSWVRVWGHAGVLFGVWAKAQVWAIIPHLDNITQVPWALQGVRQTRPEHAVPKLALRCNILPPLCCHETTHASKNSSHLYLNFFPLIPMSCCDVKLWSHSSYLQGGILHTSFLK